MSTRSRAGRRATRLALVRALPSSPFVDGADGPPLVGGVGRATAGSARRNRDCCSISDWNCAAVPGRSETLRIVSSGTVGASTWNTVMLISVAVAGSRVS